VEVCFLQVSSCFRLGMYPSEFEGESKGEETDGSVQPLGSVPSWNVLTAEEDGCAGVPACQGGGEG